MKLIVPEHVAPQDATSKRAVKPVICYPVDDLPSPNVAAYRASREGWRKTDEILIPPREAGCFDVPAGHFFRIVSVEAPQVGDLNLWNAHDHHERSRAEAAASNHTRSTAPRLSQGSER